jgi:hypothetical protein
MRFSPASSSPHHNFSPVNVVSGAIQKVGANSTTPRPKGKPLLPKPTTSHKQTPVKGKGLRVNCSPDRIDKNKLRSIVEAHQDQFWKSVAEKYGGSFDGEYLRQLWLNGLASGPFHSTDIVAIKEETMEDCRAEDPAEERAAAAQQPKIAPLETARRAQEVM